jgi:hypothetical protein
MKVWISILVNPHAGRGFAIMIEGVFPTAADAQAYHNANPVHPPSVRQITEVDIPFVQPVAPAAGP